MKSDIDIGQEKIICDGRLLSGETIPEKPLGRETQIAAFRRCLGPMLRGDRPINAWGHGPPGSGKTMVARWAVQNACASGTTRVGVYVNCWQHRSLHSVLQAIIDELKILRAEAQDTNVKLDRVRHAFHSRPAVIILDEIDRLMPSQRNEIIYGLLNLAKTGLICIANSTRALATLDQRVQSRLSPAVIEFSAYSRHLIEEILTDRARRALMPGSWSPGLIKRIAVAARGDARMAIQALRQAAAAAEETGGEKIYVRLIDPFLKQWQAIRHEARLASLSEHESIIRQLAAAKGPLGTSSLRSLYLTYCKKHGLTPVAKRTFSKYLRRLSAAQVLKVASQPAGPGGRIVQAA